MLVEPMIHINSCKFMRERQNAHCLFAWANIYYSIVPLEPDEGSADTRSNLTHDFFLWVFKPTVALNTEQNLQPPQEKGKSELPYAPWTDGFMLGGMNIEHQNIQTYWC